jgi:hypothetical protein
MLLNALASLGHKGIKTLRTFGRAGLMLFNALVGKPEFRKHAPLLVRQLYNVGVLSMLIIVVSGVFIGMVLGLQGYLVLTTYSAETSLGMLVALSLLRELGPVVAALLFAGRLFWRNLIGLTVIHRQRLTVSLLQVLTESGKVGFTLSRGRTLVILAQHQRTGVFHLYVWQQFLINNGTQIIRVGPNLRLLILQAIERFLRRLVHQLIRIGLVCRGCRTQRCNHQQSDHH